jgi:hypothetical protein
MTTTTSIYLDLQPFCQFGPNVGEQLLNSPFIRGGWEYATDGKICIRRPTIKQDDDLEGRPKAYALFDGFDPATCDRRWDAAAPAEVINDCCPQCDGEGYLYDEDRDETRCMMCVGLGRTMVEQPRRFNGVKIANVYDRLIQSLPGVLISTSDKPKRYGIVRFVFDGGQGVVMGLSEVLSGDER